MSKEHDRVYNSATGEFDGKIFSRSFTPGPWEVRERFGSHDIYQYISPQVGGRYIGTTKGNSSDLPESVKQEDAANARLIAAAPELLEALENARDMVSGWAAYADDYFQHKHDLNGDIAKLEAVIAKAKG